MRSTSGRSPPTAPCDGGAYQLPSMMQLGTLAALEPSGALVVTAFPVADPFGDKIVRLHVNAPAEVIFEEGKHAVKLHIPRLVTGP